jgi:sugar lactone lactonase YvrE
MPPESLVEGLSHPASLVDDATHLYYADVGTGVVARIPKAGGRPEIWLELEGPVSLAIDAACLYVLGVTDDGDGTLVRIDKSTRRSSELAGNLAYPADLAVDADRLYVTEAGDDRDVGIIRSVAKRGGDARVLARGQHGPAGIGLGSDSVFWTTALDSIWMVPKAGGDATVLHRSTELVTERLASGDPLPLGGLGLAAGLVLDTRPRALRRIAVDDGHVYWRAASGAIASVVDAATAIEGQTEHLEVDLSDPSALVLDSDFVYATDHEHARIVRVPRHGGRRQVCALAEPRPLAIACDDDAIYWTTAASGAGAGAGLGAGLGDGRVRRLRKVWRRARG